jgi:2-methylcitrate dehydratase PrpD
MLMGASPEVIASAVGIAASMGAGLIEANRTGGTVKRIHAGWAAHSGVVAAHAAAAGVTGPPTILEGRFGFLQAYLGERFNSGAVLAGLGEDWVMPDLFIKPYPCNHFTHAGIDAVKQLRAEGISIEQVDSLVLGVPTPVMRTIGEPLAEKIRPRSGYHAAFSGPYTVASAWVSDAGLGVFHEDFSDDAAHDPRRLEIAARVRCVADSDCDDVFPYQFPAVLTAHLRDGSGAQARIMTTRGGPQRRLSDAELERKFGLNAAMTVEPARVEKIIASVMSSDDEPVARLCEALASD